MDQNSQTASQQNAHGAGASPSASTGSSTGGNTASFGFRAVPETERQGLVNKVFASVAGRYDLMNDLMSGGLHRLWKRELITLLNPPRGATPFKLLDVAGGTGDIAMRYAKDSGPNATAVICDISPEMLEVGRRRIADAGLESRIQCIEGNAEELPFANNSFDAYTIAFGIRNVTHIDRALAEAYRVLKPGGRFLCLEFSECRVPVLDRLYDFHSFEVIPRLGQLAAGDADSYRYLAESIRRFPPQEKFAGLVRNAGFSRVTHRDLTGGIAAIHGGWKI
ncbi:bifunctional demethylmenaquinone methyltransferase/2-methoxy-6-polyprenyl-1,4-benzoquinol methylase UbiE [Hyphomicrobium sp.]|uniref:bifunctional demethylmenaquinone methyltransferase/2-methoxy-6-polyprenyl-1,4-benzoquinol methylase UbiE n=1 Tax=Hyphomicrobium sp. TaxID=82 RepID=UPI002D7697A2|nr:bifunctional demethylmenaquinone methyltransferase/2-methoxy-6-polyprenyl-1,4-benzoquinol methylase UbiE [Hyphomicrobium sp.]HET6388372.1 bifunctional demethylmenaquinone methyltransferase/2-methoxy-6-polyprenyl-1,4-benzoquinol methylase UbiE [Hyphomicrobium sp.]